MDAIGRDEMISVIIPNFNHGEFLPKRIETVLNQTHKNFEVIILDDCSSDDSQSVIAKFTPHPRISHVEFNPHNSGSPFKQWKKGIDLARGNWIWIAESDDYADLTFLEKMSEAASMYPNVGLAYCDSNVVLGDVASGERFSSIKNKKMGTTRWSEDHFNSGLDEIQEYLLPEGSINNTSAVLFNKKVLIDVNPFDIELRYTGDKYTFVKVLSRSNVAYVKEALNYFRNPFNNKHVDKFIFYFYEQFLIFNWAYRNLELTDKKKFLNGFHANTRNSLFRGWGRVKFSLYVSLGKLNPRLLIRSVLHNFWLGFRSAVGFR